MSEDSKFRFVPRNDLNEGEAFRLQHIGPDGEELTVNDPLEVAMELDDLYVDLMTDLYDGIERAVMLSKVIRSHYDKNTELFDDTPLGMLLLTDVGLTQIFTAAQSSASVLGLVRRTAIETMAAEVEKIDKLRGQQRHRPERDRQHGRPRSN